MSDAPKKSLLLVYYVADESSSMAGVVDQLNQSLVELLDALHSEPMAAAKIRLSVIGFSDSARCYLDMVDLRGIEQMPELQADGSTSYKAAIEMLRQSIEDDVAKLKAEGYSVHRPAVFFLTDGEPNHGDGWEAALAPLNSPSNPLRPNLLSFGVGRAKAETIGKLASAPGFAFIQSGSGTVADAVTNFCATFVRSVVASASALAGGAPATLQMQPPAGFQVVLDKI